MPAQIQLEKFRDEYDSRSLTDKGDGDGDSERRIARWQAQVLKLKPKILPENVMDADSVQKMRLEDLNEKYAFKK